MSDDLSKLTPTDPSAVVPDWDGRRQGILDDVLATGTPRGSGRWRWVAGAAAAVLLVGAVGGIAQQLQRDPSAIPASPTAAPSPTSTPASPTATPAYVDGDPVALTGSLTVIDGNMVLCYGGRSGGVSGGRGQSIDFAPPECRDAFVPVTGIPMPEFNNLYGSVVGTFDGSVFHATRWYGGKWRSRGNFVPEEYSSHSPPEPYEFVDLCEYQPGRGSLTGERVSPSDPSALDAMASAMPGFQGMWTEYDETSEEEGLPGPPVIGYTVAVTHGAEAAQETLLENSAFPLCVGTLPGLDEATLVAAKERVDDILFPHIEGEATLFEGEGSGVTVGESGVRLEIVILAETDEVRTRVEEAVGPDVWPWTEIRPRLESVDPAALEPGADAPVPMPPGPSTPLIITDEDRSRAEAAIATDLQDATGTSASATMAKATFEQFEALWPIDWESELWAIQRHPNENLPEFPPSANAEVLVVTLSAPLSKPYVAAVPASDDRTAIKSAGTIKVIDAATGDLIIHVTLAGGRPGDRLTELPGPREDVALPEGFN